MGIYIAKLLISATMIVVISEVAKRLPVFAAIIASLPLTSILAVVWMQVDGVETEKIASHMVATIWYVLPSFVLFIVMPILLRKGIAFWISLGVGIALTAGAYFLMAYGLKKMGIEL